ncbi:tellurium resistance protein [Selenomonas sp. CM52]|nr:tellurium resistance protein [Selenomonas sp. CM52]
MPPVPTAVPPVQPPTAPKKVELKKGQKVSLVKGGGGLGEIAINLNWHQQPQTKKQGLLASIFGGGGGAGGIDLDLGCLYELQDGEIGCVQALGNDFGSLSRRPWIALDGDDRTGSNAAGETLRVNGKMASKIKRILVYTFIYEGVANWQQADGVVTVKCPGSPDIIVRMDEYGSSKAMCAIAMLENINDTFSVEKLVHFFSGHKSMDKAYHWGLRWEPGSKD